MLRRSLLLIACTILASCAPSAASVTVVPSGSKHAVEPLRRIYVMVERRALEVELTQALGTALCRELEARGVHAKLRVLNGLSSDEREAAEEAQQWHADASLILDFVTGVASAKSFSAVTYSATLNLQGAQEPVWRAQVQSSERGFGSGQGMMEAAAQRVVERLNTDGFLSAT